MSYPPAYDIANADPAVISVLGPDPVRFTPFGEAPQNSSRPYAVWQIIYGNPANTLACPPLEDLFGVQVDCYAKTVDESRAAAQALRDAFEGSFNNVVAWNGEDWEPSTGLYRVSFTVEFWTPRT